MTINFHKSHKGLRVSGLEQSFKEMLWYMETPSLNLLTIFKLINVPERELFLDIGKMPSTIECKFKCHPRNGPPGTAQLLNVPYQEKKNP